jgi:hypothetical protein
MVARAMDKVINIDLIKNPVNWVIVFLMVSIALVGLTILTAPSPAISA